MMAHTHHHPPSPCSADTMQPVRHRARSLWATSLIATFALTGCALVGQCGSDGDEEAPEQATLDTMERALPPIADTSEATRLLGANATNAASSFIAGRDLAGILEWYPGLRDRIGVVLSEVRQFEAEIRTTFGIDLTDAATVSEAGIATDGGVAAIRVGEDVVYTLLLAYPELFEERLREVLYAQPFNLRVDVEEVDDCLLFRRQAEQTARVVACIDGPNAWLTSPPEGAENNGIALVDSVRNSGASLSDEADFNYAIDSLADHSLLAYVSFPGEVATRRAGATEPDEATLARWAQLERLGTAAIGMTANRDRLWINGFGRPTDELANQMRQIASSTEVNERMMRLVDEDAYIVLRASVRPSEMLAVARNSFDPALMTALEAQLTSIDEALGISLETDVFPHIGANQLLTASRARLLTLNRAVSGNSIRLPDLFAGLGIVGAVEVTDRAALIAVFDRLGELHEGSVTRFDDDGTTVLQFTDPQLDVGTLVLTGELLLLLPERNRNEYVAALDGEGYDLSDIAEEAGQRLVNAAGVNGVFIDMAEIRGGSAGNILRTRVPNELRAAYDMLDEIVAIAWMSEEGIDGQAALRFEPLPEPEPAATEEGTAATP